MIGFISLGSRITRHEARALKGKSDIDISMFLSHLPIATTLSDSLTGFSKKVSDLALPVLRNLQPSTAFKTTLLSKEVYAYISPLDLAVTKAGKDSKFLTNEFRNPHLAIQQLNFFVFGQINDQFMVNARVQFDKRVSGLQTIRYGDRGMVALQPFSQLFLIPDGFPLIYISAQTLILG